MIPSVETLMAVTLAGLALSASPGPSMLYVLSRSVGHSRAAGLASAAGLAAGGILLAVGAAMGLAAAVTVSPALYAIIRTTGGLYLIYLGVNTLREIRGGQEESSAQARPVPTEQSLSRIFYQGVLVELLNPKTILFFLAFLPQFVDSTGGSIAVQMLILGALVPLTAVPSDLIVAMSGGTLAERLATRRGTSVALQVLSAAVLIGLGVRIFVDF